MWLPGRELSKEPGRERVGVNGVHEIYTPSNTPCSPEQTYNLGTGTGYSVLQMVQAMEKASGKKVGPTSSTRLALQC